jgi:tripartite-type tricarboxylate transporter receptor subunit TctC
MPSRRKLLAMVAFAVVFATGGTAAAQVYPSRPITMVVPYAAGGPTDTIGRILADGMRQPLGQMVVIENVSGAGGSIGVGRVVRASPDGYMIGLGNWGSHVANGALYSLPYDLLSDFEPVSLLPSEPNVVVAQKTIAASDLREFIAWLKANPDKASAGTSGVGGPSHVAAILFQKETGTRFQLVPYRGASPAIKDLLAGQLDMMITGPSIILPHVRSGAVKAYAVTASTRLAAAPDIPTADEAGLPGFHVAVWHGLWAPKGTPNDAIAKLKGAVHDALADPAVRQRLGGLALEIPSRAQQEPDALAAHHKAEIEKWWPVIKAANIRAE